MCNSTLADSDFFIIIIYYLYYTIRLDSILSSFLSQKHTAPCSEEADNQILKGFQFHQLKRKRKKKLICFITAMVPYKEYCVIGNAIKSVAFSCPKEGFCIDHPFLIRGIY